MATQYFSNFNESTIFSDQCIQMTLTSGTELTHTIAGDSTDQYQAIFSYNCSETVFVGLNNTAAVPADDTVTTDRFVENKPKKMMVKGTDVLHFITPDTKTYCSVSFRKIP